MGGIFSYTDSTVANFRQKDDAVNGAIGGCAAGFVLGAAARSVPMMFGGCASLAALIGTFDAAGKSLQGTYARASATDFSHGHDAAPGTPGWREAREARRQSFFKVRTSEARTHQPCNIPLTFDIFVLYSATCSKRRRTSNPMHRRGGIHIQTNRLIVLTRNASECQHVSNVHSRFSLRWSKATGEQTRSETRMACTFQTERKPLVYDKEAPTKPEDRTPFSVFSKRGFLSASGSAASGRAPTQAHSPLSVTVYPG